MSEHIEFGRWVIREGCPAEPLVWLALGEAKGAGQLLVTRDIVERRLFAELNRAVTWADSDLRTWLNSDFLDTAFSDEERSLIADTPLETPDNPESGTEGGPATNDKVFLLSRDEAQHVFASDDERCARATPHAVSQGCCSNWWWLRSPGEYQSGPEVVLGDGRIYNCSGHYNRNLIGVRPALCIRPVGSFWANS